MKRIKNQQGFSVLEVLLVLVFLAIVAFAGYHVYHAQKKSSKTTASSTAKQSKNSPKSKLQPETTTLLSGTTSEAAVPTADAESTMGNVSFVRPNSWRPDADITADGCGVTGCIGQKYIVPAKEDEAGANPPDYFLVVVSAFDTTQDAKTIFASNWQDTDGIAAYSSFTTTAGTTGFKYDFEFNGTDASSKYTEHVAYGISNGSHAAILDVTYFNGPHGSFANASNTDYGQYAAAVQQIAKSLTITQ